MKVSLLDIAKQTYCKLNASSTPLYITQEEFESRTNKKETACINTTCANLGIVVIRLGDLKARLSIIEFVMQELDGEYTKLKSEFEVYTDPQRSLDEMSMIYIYIYVYIQEIPEKLELVHKRMKDNNRSIKSIKEQLLSSTDRDIMKAFF